MSSPSPKSKSCTAVTPCAAGLRKLSYCPTIRHSVNDTRKPYPGQRTRRSTAAAPCRGAGGSPAPLFDPVEREPAYTRVSSAIEAKILSRALRDGDRAAARKLDLAQQFRVHRSTVREALRQLESAGLVTRPPGAKRMIVSRPHAAKVASGMRHALVLHDVSFVDVWEAMMVIEPEVAALAATRRTQADLDALVQVSRSIPDVAEGRSARRRRRRGVLRGDGRGARAIRCWCWRSSR